MRILWCIHGSLMAGNVDSLTWKWVECTWKILRFCLFSASIRRISFCKRKKYEELCGREVLGKEHIYSVFALNHSNTSVYYVQCCIWMDVIRDALMCEGDDVMNWDSVWFMWERDDSFCKRNGYDAKRVVSISHMLIPFLFFLFLVWDLVYEFLFWLCVVRKV